MQIDENRKVVASEAGQVLHHALEEMQAQFIRLTDRYPKVIAITEDMGVLLEAYFLARKHSDNVRDEKHTYFGAKLVWDAPYLRME